MYYDCFLVSTEAASGDVNSRDPARRGKLYTCSTEELQHADAEVTVAPYSG